MYTFILLLSFQTEQNILETQKNIFLAYLYILIQENHISVIFLFQLDY